MIRHKLPFFRNSLTPFWSKHDWKSGSLPALLNRWHYSSRHTHSIASLCTAENFSEFSSKYRIHPCVYKRIHCIGEIHTKIAEEFDITWHRRHEAKASQNNDNPKWDPAYHERQHNCEKWFTYLDLTHSNVAECFASLDCSWCIGVVLLDHLCNFYVTKYCC